MHDLVVEPEGRRGAGRDRKRERERPDSLVSPTDSGARLRLICQLCGHCCVTWVKGGTSLCLISVFSSIKENITVPTQ